MTGIERLREFVAGISPITVVCGVTRTAYDREHMEVAGARLRDFLADIADQIEREQGGRVSRMRVLAVVTEMERHVSGVEGMEDSPVARWARELREALTSNEAEKMKRGHADDVSMSAYDLLPQEERDAIAWVREHGGLSHVKDIYHDFRAVVERLGIEWSESELHGLMDALDRRLMPEGYEWPRYDPDEPVRFGDEFLDHQGNVRSVLSVKMFQEGGFELGTGQGTYDWHSAGERVKRPAPAILAADGEPLEVGQTVWLVDTGAEYWVKSGQTITADAVVIIRKTDCDCESEIVKASQLTHQRPVLDADGVPIHEGDHGWWVEQPGVEIVVKHIDPDECDQLTVCDVHGRGNTIGADEFTHTKPEPPDSWERIADEIDRLREDVALHLGDYLYDSDGNDSIQFSMECVAKRCRALAERERGE